MGGVPFWHGFAGLGAIRQVCRTRAEKSHRQMLFAGAAAYIIERWSSCTAEGPASRKERRPEKTRGRNRNRERSRIRPPSFLPAQWPIERIRLLLKSKMFVKKIQKREFSIFLNTACYCNIFNDKKLTITHEF